MPKVAGTSSLSEFRHISLIHGVYKILAKMLSLRLRCVLPRIILYCQFAFVSNRNIHECSFLASKILHSIHKSRKRSFVLKLDFHKAVDRISWNYMDKVMSRMGFSSTWLSWMISCRQSSSTSILVNGSPTRNIYLQKGVKQGDPLSPFLFALAVEGLKRMIDKAVECGYLFGLRLCDESPLLSLLQFADAIPYVFYLLMKRKFELLSDFFAVLNWCQV